MSPASSPRSISATGALTPFGQASADHCARDLAFAPDGTLYGIVATTATFMQLVRFDITTGVVTVIGQITSFGFTQFSAGGLTFDNTGTLYAQFAADDPELFDVGSVLPIPGRPQHRRSHVRGHLSLRPDHRARSGWRV